MQWSQRGYKWRHSIAYTLCMLDKQDYTHAGACMHTHAPEQPHKHLRTHARTHKYKTTYCFFTVTMIRQRASMLRYTYIACLVVFYMDVSTNSDYFPIQN